MLSLCNTAPNDLNNVSFVLKIIAEWTKSLSAPHQGNFLGTEKICQWLFIHIPFQRPEVKLTLRHKHAHTRAHISISTAAQNVSILDWRLSHALIMSDSTCGLYLLDAGRKASHGPHLWWQWYYECPLEGNVGPSWESLAPVMSKDLLSTSFSGSPPPRYNPEQSGTRSGRWMIPLAFICLWLTFI